MLFVFLMKVAAGAASCWLVSAEEEVLSLVGLLRRHRRRGEGETSQAGPRDGSPRFAGGASRRVRESSRRGRGAWCAGEASRRGRGAWCAGEASRRGRGSKERRRGGGRRGARLFSRAAWCSSRRRCASAPTNGGSSASPRRYALARSKASSSFAMGPLAVISLVPPLCLRPMQATETPVRCHTASAAAWFQVRTVSDGMGIGAEFPCMPRDGAKPPPTGRSLR